MKFLLDANVEFRLATFLTSLGHDVKTIAHDFPASLTDHEVLALAVKEQRILLTNDRDYGELIFRQHLPHRGRGRAGAGLLRRAGPPAGL